MARHKTSRFEETYGVHCGEFAAAEGVSPEAIRMRLKHFGTPFKRRAKPTTCEIITGHSTRYLSKVLGIHFNYVSNLLTTKAGQNKLFVHMSKPEHAAELLSDNDLGTWLMPQHPDADTWRYKTAQGIYNDPNKPGDGMDMREFLNNYKVELNQNEKSAFEIIDLIKERNNGIK